MSAPTTEQLLTVERARNADNETLIARLRRDLKEQHDATRLAAEFSMRKTAQLEAARKEIARKEVYIQQLQRKVRAALIQDQPAQEA